MNFRFNAAAAIVLAASLVSSSAYAADGTPREKKHTATGKKKAPAKPSVEEQIEGLRHDLENQINGLKSDLASKDAQLKQAQQAAADAQAAAAKAEAAASSQQQAVSDNAAAVTTLQTTVTDLKANAVSLATTVSDETAKIKKDIANPSTLHYKGITLTPGGFVEAATVYRTHATGGEIPTAFSALPYEHADAYSLSEFYGTARQSRLSLMAEGKVPWGTLRGYYEADFLGTGISSNNNQSNSYVLRQRVVWAQAETNSHWAFTAGQLWSLATEDKKGISNLSGDILTPQTIDPNYVTGFVWTRQFGARVTKTFNKAAFGFAIENPQILYSASLGGNTAYSVIGSAGANGGNYNAAISACSPSTSIVNYTNQTEYDSAGNLVNVAVPVYKTVNGCANIANYSFNQAPDVIVKAAFDPGFGHYEIFGIGRFAHQTIYPGENTNGYLYGGLKDILTGKVVAPALTSAGWYVNDTAFGGIGASARIVTLSNKLTLGAKGLFGPGVGRYGNSTLSDLTARGNGQFSAIHNLSGLLTAELAVSPRLTLWANYGGDYAGRDASFPGYTVGAPSACFVVPGLYGCQKQSKLTPDQVAAGTWGATWKVPSEVGVGYGSKLANNSSCLTTAAPGYNGGASTGYAPGGSCGASTRDVQEVTGGYWYDIYRGDHGRLRQGVQYGYAVREGWSGAPVVTGGPGIGAKGVDNMFWTTFRYYLP